MRLLVQRVSKANITIDKKLKRDMQEGLLVYLGIKKNENEEVIKKAVDKLLKLRFFENEEGKLKKSIIEICGKILVVSNFTLYGTSKKGTTLSFDESANFDEAKRIYDMFLEELNEKYSNYITGEFGSYMEIEAISDGPVNVLIEI